MTPSHIVPTGNDGLDFILHGGLPSNRLYLLEGAPGSGKTTLALEFLFGGARRGEKGLYVTLSETRDELAAVAQSHGWDLDAFDVFELSAVEDALEESRDQSVLHPWEMELTATIELVEREVERVRPARVVFDSLSEMRLLAQDPLRYRRQVLALKQFFAGRESTVVIVDDLSSSPGGRDNHLHSLCHGVITLERVTLDYGAARRRLLIQKIRGVDFVGGYHDYMIRKGGLEVFPRLVASARNVEVATQTLPSGVPELDALVNGGPLRGTSMLITGPAGSGKTTIAMKYIEAACKRGEPAAIFEFDERISTMLTRSRAFGMDLEEPMREGRLNIHQIDPAEMSPGEFAARVRREVDESNARIIVIDSLNGYIASMPEEQHLILQMHEMLAYLSQRGVVTLLLDPQHGLVGSTATSINVSYVADIVLLLRYFEAGGRIRKAISVLKNRGGPHEDTIRELRIDAGGVRVGAPLEEFRGVLTGSPEYTGGRARLLDERAAHA